MIHIFLFLVGTFCSGSILISEVNSKTDTFKFNNMILNIEKSGAFEKNISREPNRPEYVVRGEKNKFQIEFFTSMTNLKVTRMSPNKIKVVYDSKDRSTSDTYLEISIRNHAIKSFKIFDFYTVKKAQLSSKLDIKT
ncbi:hypothetical protein EHEL_020210 [Encephalitozoon hellem ATCC 50504]|uniref:Uncharacterized protein n=1 Tax=Encephalitozoon hellem TaxID=27973 RepID=A0A9Q9F7Q0_ENCHE|nr:uncharacterized protein EHEL_020210 [Encephalitozoon hellem ATCC 50504]AFM97778.1 hypothetical protein EHEL_020210 [Encephalitozoon hellem ATCC 50504]UTX42548.1 hypothetical protein GPU96_02g02580 [Encephalitozoon hellem]WEL38003.1 hypothetical protein PFJ87_02g00390 [Encephalitozoon hellem]|eukprot:XP_003886759.1 hypothetical protein EHEL_020210 [Encephalitozoon hellem ATCC 50504]